MADTNEVVRLRQLQGDTGSRRLGPLPDLVSWALPPAPHASIGITLDTYSHVLPSMQAEAAEAVDAIFGASR